METLGGSFSKCSSEQTAWKDLLERVCLQMRDEEGQDCEQNLPAGHAGNATHSCLSQ